MWAEITLIENIRPALLHTLPGWLAGSGVIITRQQPGSSAAPATTRSYETSARPHLSGGKIIISANVSLIAVIISK